MKITFLGTNGWYTTPTGNTPCIVVDTKEYYVVFDAGNGLSFLDEYITDNKPICLFISHFHLDHVSGFHSAAKFSFSQGIDVYMAKGRKKDFQNLVHPPYTVGTQKSPKNIHNLKVNIRLHELQDGKHTQPFPIEVIEQHHAYGDHGYRITLDGKTVAYSGDCGISENSYALAKDADVLIHECSYLANHAPDVWGHVGPVEAAQLAKDASVKKLILTHFDASKYTTLEKRTEAEKIAKQIFPNTIAAIDELEIKV